MLLQMLRLCIIAADEDSCTAWCLIFSTLSVKERGLLRLHQQHLLAFCLADFAEVLFC